MGVQLGRGLVSLTSALFTGQLYDVIIICIFGNVDILNTVNMLYIVE